jgi:hypothetical protein
MWFHSHHAFEYHSKLVALAWIIFFYETLKFFKIDFFQRKKLKGKIIEFSKKINGLKSKFQNQSIIQHKCVKSCQGTMVVSYVKQQQSVSMLDTTTHVHTYKHYVSDIIIQGNP